MLFKQNLSAIDQNGSVDSRLAGIWRCRKGHACDYRRGKFAGCAGKFCDGLPASSEETGLLKKIRGRIAADGKF